MEPKSHCLLLVNLQTTSIGNNCYDLRICSWNVFSGWNRNRRQYKDCIHMYMGYDTPCTIVNMFVIFADKKQNKSFI